MLKTSTRKHHRNGSYDIRADLEKIKEAFTDTARDIKGRAGEIITTSADTVKDRFIESRDDLEKNVTKYVTKKPFRALGASLASGLLVGFILRGLLRKRRR